MSIEVGQKVTGKVTGITNFGAFVDLGDHQTGLVHISEISDSYVKDIHDVLSVGDEVTVKVLSMKDGKIGLSIRKAEDHPKSSVTSEHHTEHRSNHSYNNTHRPSHNHSSSAFGSKHHSGAGKEDFDSLLSGYLKESEDRLTSLRRNTEGKRGGRGGRRS